MGIKGLRYVFWAMGLVQGHLLGRGWIDGNNAIKLVELRANMADEANVNNPKTGTSSAKCSENQVVRRIG